MTSIKIHNYTDTAKVLETINECKQITKLETPRICQPENLTHSTNATVKTRKKLHLRVSTSLIQQLDRWNHGYRNKTI